MIAKHCRRSCSIKVCPLISIKRCLQTCKLQRASSKALRWSILSHFHSMKRWHIRSTHTVSKWHVKGCLAPCEWECSMWCEGDKTFWMFCFFFACVWYHRFPTLYERSSPSRNGWDCVVFKPQIELALYPFVSIKKINHHCWDVQWNKNKNVTFCRVGLFKLSCIIRATLKRKTSCYNEKKFHNEKNIRGHSHPHYIFLCAIFIGDF